ncbi:hypothetical protein NU09_2264 [Flavobacterium beibuense]|uniref:Uncharacterized protein n=1 Tax=Flavobacterium beibuense TaxID=657326 RepID=A0A444WA35_9FLAO|nr:hypothetical protein NU09_2264 [Flavobacterium beibuense]
MVVLLLLKRNAAPSITTNIAVNSEAALHGVAVFAKVNNSL